MIGPINQLNALVSGQEPEIEIVDLHCYEQMPPEEEAESFIVATECALCIQPLAVEIQPEIWAVEAFRHILQNYRFLCPDCYWRSP